MYIAFYGSCPNGNILSSSMWTGEYNEAEEEQKDAFLFANSKLNSETFLFSGKALQKLSVFLSFHIFFFADALPPPPPIQCTTAWSLP